MNHLQSKQVRHCRTAARTHGTFAADMYSIRAYLRVIALLLTSLEGAVKSKPINVENRFKVAPTAIAVTPIQLTSDRKPVINDENPVTDDPYTAHD